MITINRKSVDALLKNMDLFTYTKVAIAKYKEELKQLEARGEKLAEKLAAVQSEHTNNLLKLNGTTDVDEIIKLKFENINLVSNSKVINSLLESLDEEKSDLKTVNFGIINNVFRYPKYLCKCGHIADLFNAIYYTSAPWLRFTYKVAVDFL